MSDITKEVIVFDREDIAKQNRSKGGKAIVSNTPAKEGVVFASRKSDVEKFLDKVPPQLELERLHIEETIEHEGTTEKETEGKAGLSLTNFWLLGRLFGKKKTREKVTRKIKADFVRR
jgi:hypothetical protein